MLFCIKKRVGRNLRWITRDTFHTYFLTYIFYIYSRRRSILFRFINYIPFPLEAKRTLCQISQKHYTKNITSGPLLKWLCVKFTFNYVVLAVYDMKSHKYSCLHIFELCAEKTHHVGSLSLP